MRASFSIACLVLGSLCALGCGLDATGTATQSQTDGGSIVDAQSPVDANRPDAMGASDAGSSKQPPQTLAAGAVITNSPSYTVIMTLGQGPGDNSNVTSPSYRINAGLVGATQ